MPEIVNQYSHTFIGQAIESKWKFQMPNLPKLREENYFEIDVSQIGMRRYGTSAPHDLFFFVADIQGSQSKIVVNNAQAQIDSRVNLGMIVNYDSGTAPALLTSPAPVSFRLKTMQPANPFMVTACRLAAQEIGPIVSGSLVPPTTLVPMGKFTSALFAAQISNGSGLAGTILDVNTMISSGETIGIGQLITTSTGATNTIVSLGTGTGGLGTYNLIASQLVVGDNMTATTTDTTSNPQLIMTWSIKEMSPYPIPRNEVMRF